MRAIYFLLPLLHCSTLFCAEQVRAAIDFGSGAVKIQVVVVETEENRLVGDPLLATYIPLNLTEDVAKNNGRISDEIEKQALEILSHFKDLAFEKAAFYDVQFSGAATAVFRKAENGRELLNKFEEILGIPFQILPQDIEGKLGFLTAKALNPTVSEQHLLSWDSGNGSFQMTAKDEGFQVYEGPLGHGTVRVMLAKDVREGPLLPAFESGNPVFREEANALTQKIRQALPETPDWLHAKLANDEIQVATFGDGESIFALVAEALSREKVQKRVIKLPEVYAVIDAYIEKSDELFDQEGLHRKTLTSAVHLAAVMEHFGMKEIHYTRSVGSTAGMLIAPELWNKGDK